MDSGIYRLTYQNGATYVGKSIHLNTRWKQHFDKLSKGKAAKEMQQAFHASGNQFPRTEVLVYCHPDMLDYYEGYFINELKPPLNTAIPQELPEAAKQTLVKHANRGFANYSVVTVLDAMENQTNKLLDLQSDYQKLEGEFEELEGDYELLEEGWDNRAMRDNWAIEKFRETVAERDSLWELKAKLEQKMESLESWRLRVESANWWQRLWRTW
jgi:excinuclease UvrABC nuclease subunit